jgi:hypothetical protein
MRMMQSTTIERNNPCYFESRMHFDKHSSSSAQEYISWSRGLRRTDRRAVFSCGFPQNGFQNGCDAQHQPQISRPPSPIDEISLNREDADTLVKLTGIKLYMCISQRVEQIRVFMETFVKTSESQITRLVMSVYWKASRNAAYNGSGSSSVIPGRQAV